ncbi:MAG: hypothetical protein AAFQ37_10630 [Bacteroidota bacterium]
MKYLFFLGLIISFSGLVSAQSSNLKMDEVETTNSYTFSIKTDRNRVNKLLDIYNEIDGGKSGFGMHSISTMELGDGLQLYINTRRRVMKVSYVGTNKDILGKAKKLSKKIKKAFKQPDTPEPPTPSNGL